MTNKVAKKMNKRIVINKLVLSGLTLIAFSPSIANEPKVKQRTVCTSRRVNTCAKVGTFFLTLFWLIQPTN